MGKRGWEWEDFPNPWGFPLPNTNHLSNNFSSPPVCDCDWVFWGLFLPEALYVRGAVAKYFQEGLPPLEERLPRPTMNRRS